MEISKNHVTDKYKIWGHTMQDIPTIMEDMCSQMHNVGNNRIVTDAHGNVEEVNHYYPWRAHGRQPQHRPAALQVHRKGAGPHSQPGLVRPRCPPLRPVPPLSRF